MRVITQRNNGSIRQLLWTRTSRLFATVFAIHAAIALAVGEGTWDDGYITLAFARTFAETGHIGLTPYSGTVEGATCPLWFLLMAGLDRLGITGFYGLHLAAQLLAALCAAIAAVLLYRLIRPSAPGLAWWISLITLLLGPFRAETANGMEMTLLCVLILGIMNLIRDSDEQPLRGLVIVSAVVPWVRLEVSGYVIMGAVAIVVLSRQYRVGLAIIGSSVLSIFTLTIVRYLVFGTVVLTNTMIAKTLSPYTPPFGTPAWAHQFIQGTVLEPLAILIPCVVLGFFLLRISGSRAKDRLGQLVQSAKFRELPARISFGTIYYISYIAFILVFGCNYFSRPGRMGASAILALVAVAVLAIPVVRPVQSPRLRNKLAVAALILVPWLGVGAEDTLWIYLGHFASDATVARHSTTAYRKNGEAIQHVGELLGRPVISALFADVGAASLCCQHIQVLDLGLLANADLSKAGWGKFSDYIADKRPDLIQTHGVWSQESGIYENSYFRRNYTPVVVYDSLFYLRNDHFRSVETRCVEASVSRKYFYSDWEALSSKKNSQDVSVIDHDYIDSLHLTTLCRLP